MKPVDEKPLSIAVEAAGMHRILLARGCNMT